MPTDTVAALDAFPLTPLRDDRLDEAALQRIIQRLAAAGVSAITVLGSTGAGAYLDRAERTRVVRLAVDAAGEVPVHAGVSALRTAHALAEDAAAPGCLPRPLLGLGAEDRAEVADVVDRVLDGGPATRP